MIDFDVDKFKTEELEEIIQKLSNIITKRYEEKVFGKPKSLIGRYFKKRDSDSYYYIYSNDFSDMTVNSMVFVVGSDIFRGFEFLYDIKTSYSFIKENCREISNEEFIKAFDDFKIKMSNTFESKFNIIERNKNGKA